MSALQQVLEEDWSPMKSQELAAHWLLAAGKIMQLPPDFTIGDPGDDYLRRWYIQRSRERGCVYLHEILRDDIDRALHTHPWPFRSLILRGGYNEVVSHPWEPRVAHTFRAGDWNIHDDPNTPHRLEVLPGAGETTLSIVFTGPNTGNSWGFWCAPDRFVNWEDFVDPDNTGRVGRGCGE